MSGAKDAPNTRTPAEKVPLIFEAVKRTLLAYGMLLERLRTELASLEEIIESGAAVQDSGAGPLVSAVGLVDFAYRYHQLVDALPLINKRHPPLKALASALQSVGPARHHLQHMRGDLMTAEQITYPILGSLAWANGARGFTISFSHAGAAHPSLVWDRHEGRFVADLEYTVKDATVRLASIHTSMLEAYQWLAKAYQFDPPTFAELTWGNTLAVTISWEEISTLPSAETYRFIKAQTTRRGRRREN